MGNVGEYLRDMVQVHNANFGTQIMFTSSPYNLWDSHAIQYLNHSGLLHNTATNVEAFMSDLRQLNISDNVVMLLYTEFGRRAQDNGSGTDHGAGGMSFVIGEQVKGGLYGEFPSLKVEELDVDGNLQWNVDFRSIYTTLLEGWLGVDAKPIVGWNLRATRLPVNSNHYQPPDHRIEIGRGKLCCPTFCGATQAILLFLCHWRGRGVILIPRGWPPSNSLR